MNKPLPGSHGHRFACPIAAVCLLVFANLGFACSPSGRPVVPTATRGEIDLSSFDWSEPLELNGEWAWFPGELATDGRTLTARGQDMVRSIARAPTLNWAKSIAGQHDPSGRPLKRHGCLTQIIRVRLPAAVGPTEIALRIDDFSMASRTWVVKRDGTVRLLAQFGKVSCSGKDARAALEHRIVRLQPAEADLLVVERANFWSRDLGGGRPLLIGSLGVIENLANGIRSRDFWSIGFLAVIGIYHFLLFALRRSLLAALWLGVWCLLTALRVYLLGRYAQVDMGWGGLSLFLYRIEYLTVPLLPIVAMLYTRALFGRAVSPRFFGFAMLYAGAGCVFTALAPVVVYTRALPALQLSTAFAALWFVFQVGFFGWTASERPIHRTARTLAAVGAILIAAVFHDNVVAYLRLPRTQIGHYGLVVFMLGQAYLIAGQTEQAHRAAELLGVELRRMDAIKDQFLANLSHELRTPLTVVHGYAEMLAESDGQAAHIGRTILTGSQQLADRVDDLMLVTELEAPARLERKRILVADLVEGILADPLLIGAAEERNVRIATDIPPGLALFVDVRLLSKALRAPVQNGILYNHANGTLSVSAAQADMQIHINIADTGPGIANEHLPLIWEKFYRVDRSSTYSVSGVGLGLYICRRIVQMHDGACAASSSDGGTTVTISLPGGQPSEPS